MRTHCLYAEALKVLVELSNPQEEEDHTYFQPTEQTRKKISNCFDKRQDHLEKKALFAVHEEDAASKNVKVTKKVKQMKNEEQICKMYQVFKTYLKAGQKAALSHVDVPDFHKMWLALLAMMGIIYSTRGRWGWIFVHSNCLDSCTF
eukprot:648108-Ditylum_brightwellii.AAC.1